jgi:hypothetical protein
MNGPARRESVLRGFRKRQLEPTEVIPVMGGRSGAHVKSTVRRGTPRARFGLSDYVPFSDAIYDAAITGYVAGAYDGVDATSPDSAAYDPSSEQAQAFGAAVDTAIAAGSPFPGQIFFVAQICQALNRGKWTRGLPEDAFSVQAETIAAAYTSITAVLIAYSFGGGGGSGFVIWTQDCTAGGTVVYDGPTPVANCVILTGTPAGEVSYQFPTAQHLTVCVNETGQLVGFGNPANTDIVLSPTPGSTVVYGDGVVGSNLKTVWTDSLGGDLICVQNAFAPGQQIVLTDIADINQTHTGSRQLLTVWGVVTAYQDATTFGVTPPAIGQDGTEDSIGRMWYTAAEYSSPSLFAGLQSVNGSGASTILVAEAYYPNAPQNTQKQITAGVKFGDTATGPGAQGIFFFPMIDGTLTFTAKFQLTVVSTAGVTETVGDVYSVTHEACIKSVGGVLSVVPTVGTAASSIFSDTSMVGTIAAAGVQDNQSGLHYQLNMTLDPTTVVDVQARILEADYM